MKLRSLVTGVSKTIESVSRELGFSQIISEKKIDNIMFELKALKLTIFAGRPICRFKLIIWQTFQPKAGLIKISFQPIPQAASITVIPNCLIMSWWIVVIPIYFQIILRVWCWGVDTVGP